MLNENITAMENKYELNRTMINASLSLDECQNFFHDEDHLNVTDRRAVPIALHNATWPYTTDELQNAATALEDASEGKPTAADALMRCYCFSAVLLRRGERGGHEHDLDRRRGGRSVHAVGRGGGEGGVFRDDVLLILFGGAAGQKYQGVVGAPPGEGVAAQRGGADDDRRRGER